MSHQKCWKSREKLKEKLAQARFLTNMLIAEVAGGGAVGQKWQQAIQSRAGDILKTLKED